MAMVKTRVQYRGVCCVCGKSHAVKGEDMVSHGYTVDWGMFNNSCAGAKNPHYGSEKAPEFLTKYIASLVVLLNELPAMIAASEIELNALEAEKNDLIKKRKSFHSPEYKSVGMQIKEAHRQLRVYGVMLDGALQESIDAYREKLTNWAKAEPIAVDLDVEEAEQRKARQAEAEQKKADKQAEKLAKEAKKAEREAKALLKEKAFLNQLAQENYYYLYCDGELVSHWVATATSENEVIKYYHEYRKEFTHKSITSVAGGSFYFEVRTQADGKGKRIYDLLPFGTAKQYFEHFKG